MAAEKLFIEPRDKGGFGAKREGSTRSLVIADTQAEVIEEVKARYPDAALYVARVRYTGPRKRAYRRVY